MGGTATLSVVATGEGTLSYEWFKVEGGVAASVGNAQSYATPTNLAVGTHTYRVVVSGEGVCGVATSNDVTVTVHAPTVITTQPLSPSAYCEGGSATLSVVATGEGALSYQWFKVVGGTVEEIVGATASTYATPTNLAVGTHTYRVVVRGEGACGEVTSEDVTVTVNNVLPGSIGGTQTVCAGTTPVILGSTVDGSGFGNITYRWESSIDGGTTWTPITNATAASYSPSALTTTTSFRRVAISTVNNIACEAISDPVTVNVVNDCTIVSNKTVDAGENNKADASEELTYTITVTNNYDRDITVKITDIIPTYTTYVSNATGGNYNADDNEITWDNITVPANNNTTVSFVVKVTDNLTNISEIKNVATVTGNEIPQPQKPEVTINTNPQPSHTFRKEVADASGDGKAQAGEELTYTITVTNTGDVALTGISISDDIPANTAYVAGSADNGGTLSGSTLNWIVDVPFGGSTAVSFKVTVADDLTGIKQVSNIATVEGEDTPPVDIPTDSVPSHTFRKEVADASGDGKAQAGEELTYTITVTNTGDVALTGISISDDIPANTAYVAGSATGGIAPVDSRLTWTVDVPFGGSTSVSFRVKVAENLTDIANIRNIATVNDTETPPVDIPTEENPSHGSEKTVVDANGDNKAQSGEELMYTITVTNTGDVDLKGIAISDGIPAHTSYVDGSATGGIAPVDGKLNWTIDVPFGGTASVSFKVKVVNDLTDIENISNIATVGDDNPGVEIPTDRQPLLSIVKAADVVSGAKRNSTVTYTFVVTNDGNVTVSGITVNDPLLGGVIDNATGTWPSKVGTLAPGESVSLQGKYKVTQADVLAGKIVNTATVKGIDPLDTAGEQELPERPSNEVTVETAMPIIDAVDDGPYRINGFTGGTTPSVFGNDLLDNAPVIPAEVRLTWTTDEVPEGLTLNLDGTVAVASATRAGTHVLGYRICEVLNLVNCDQAIITVIVEPAPLEAVDDNYRMEWSRDEMVTGSVLDNDRFNNGSIDLNHVTLTPGTPSDPGLRMNPDGTITIAPSTRPGTYTYPYTICEVLNPTSCKEAIATIVIESKDLFIPNIFTPDGDGTNDTFEIVGIEHFDRISLLVINRWGNEVYRNDSYDNKWNGHGLNNGTYYYIITTYKDGRSEVIKGWVMIKGN